jgi:hypothetical protein
MRYLIYVLYGLLGLEMSLAGVSFTMALIILLTTLAIELLSVYNYSRGDWM